MLKVGLARANITPPPGCNVPGGHFPRAGTHVHDDLYATAMVVDNDEERVALVGLDALSVKHSTVQAGRKLAHKLCGIAPGNIMVGASHTHCGGPTCDCLGSRPEKWYCDFVGKQIGAAVAEADRAKRPAVIAIGSGQEGSVAFNRRFVMKDGNERTHPGKMNPDIRKIAGPIDPEVGVIAVFAADGVGGVTDPEQSRSVTAPTTDRGHMKARSTTLLRSAYERSAGTGRRQHHRGQVQAVLQLRAQLPGQGHPRAERAGLGHGGALHRVRQLRHRL